MKKLNALLFVVFLFLQLAGWTQVDQASVDQFVKRYATQQKIAESEVRGLLDKAVYQESIIEKMNRPAEAMPWYRYRNIFMSTERIDAGVKFWNDYKTEITQVSQSTGVAPEIIIGIIGVETFYGKLKGSYRVIDALYTLAFAYPKRATYFTRELEEFLILCKEENFDPLTVKGSYAGAMGYCQFMPSSYRAYAKSFDPSNNRDLITNADDAIASAANYLKVHHWEKDGPIAIPAIKAESVESLKTSDLKPKQTIAYYNGLGYSPAERIGEDSKVALIQLEQESGNEYWFGYQNFYVITRYNHSSLYAMVVSQLATEIKNKIR